VLHCERQYCTAVLAGCPLSHTHVGIYNLEAKKKKQRLDNTNPTINEVKELIDRLNKKKNAINQC
jgi:hypothetical protein